VQRIERVGLHVERVAPYLAYALDQVRQLGFITHDGPN
jgi:hypothetical protein